MQIDRFVVLGELARGGLGVVYRAQDTALQREVALKVLQDVALESDVARTRFQREAEALQRLRHPNIVPFCGAGEVRGCPYLAMTLVDGETLQARIRRQGTLAPREAARFTHALAQALHHAHQAGVIHRDVKPSNVLIDADDRPLLTDFGLAGELTPGSGSKLTRTGMYLGTPGYWAPEQARGQVDRIGPAADVYALGATLYACLTGVPPVRDTSDLGALLDATVNTPPTPPRELSPDVDAALQAICLKALAKDPGDRYPTAEAFAWDLAAYLAEKPRSRRTRAPVAVGALTLLGLGVVVALANRTAAPAAVATTASPTPSVPAPDPYASPAALPPPSPTPKPPASSSTPSTTSRPPASSSTPSTTPSEDRRALARRHLDRAKAAVTAGKVKEGGAHYTRAVEADPAWWLPRIKRGGYLEQLNRDEDALRDYEAVVKLAPERAEGHFNRANLLLRLNRVEAALRDYDRAHELAPKDPQILTNRGVAKRRAGDLRGARADYTAALLLNPNDYRALGNRGRVHLALRQPGPALLDFQAALKRTPRSHGRLRLDVHQNCAKILFDMKRYGDAVPHLQLLAQRRPSSEVLLSLAECYRRLRRKAEAVRATTRALELAPADHVDLRARTHSARGRLHIQLGQYELALRDMRAVVRLAPSPRAYLNQGAAYSRLGRYPEAIRSYTECLRRDPTEVFAYANRGNCYVRTGEYAKAIPDLQRAVKAMPAKDPYWWSRLSRALLNTRGPEEALRVVNRGIARFSKAPVLRLQRARVHEARGATQDAIVDLETAIAALPADHPQRRAAQTKLAALRAE